MRKIIQSSPHFNRNVIELTGHVLGGEVDTPVRNLGIEDRARSITKRGIVPSWIVNTSNQAAQNVCRWTAEYGQSIRLVPYDLD